MIVAMLAFALLAKVSLIKSLGAGWNRTANALFSRKNYTAFRTNSI